MSHGHSTSKTHAHDAQAVAKHVKIYLVVFVALLVGTILTVWLNSVHFDSLATTITIALFVAAIKAFLVAGFFMHLISEKKAIYAMLLSTAFFLVAMMFLLIWSRDQLPRGSEFADHPHDPLVIPAAH
jgi:cytochrome c oxidase subunit 4